MRKAQEYGFGNKIAVVARAFEQRILFQEARRRFESALNVSQSD
jgi:hypothetical protein